VIDEQVHALADAEESDTGVTKTRVSRHPSEPLITAEAPRRWALLGKSSKQFRRDECRFGSSTSPNCAWRFNLAMKIHEILNRELPALPNLEQGCSASAASRPSSGSDHLPSQFVGVLAPLRKPVAQTPSWDGTEEAPTTNDRSRNSQSPPRKRSLSSMMHPAIDSSAATETPNKRARPISPSASASAPAPAPAPKGGKVIRLLGIITARSIARCTVSELEAEGMGPDDPRLCWAGYGPWVKKEQDISDNTVHLHAAAVDAFNTYLVDHGLSLPAWLAQAAGKSPQIDVNVICFRNSPDQTESAKECIIRALNNLLRMKGDPAADAPSRTYGSGTAEQIRTDLETWLSRVTTFKPIQRKTLCKAIGALGTFIEGKQLAGEAVDSVDTILSGTPEEVLKNETVVRFRQSNVNTNSLNSALRCAKLMRMAGKEWVPQEPISKFPVEAFTMASLEAWIGPTEPLASAITDRADTEDGSANPNERSSRSEAAR